MFATAALGRHAAHVVVFGLPAVILVGAIGWQELRARFGGHAAHSGRRAPSSRLDRSPALAIASAGLIVGGAVHLVVMPEHFREYTLYGVFFALLALTQLLVAWGILVAPTRRFVRAIAVTSIGVIALWIASRTTGIPIGEESWSPERVGMLDVVASTAEAITAAACVVALVGPRFRAAHPGHRIPGLVR